LGWGETSLLIDLKTRKIYLKTKAFPSPLTLVGWGGEGEDFLGDKKNRILILVDNHPSLTLILRTINF